MVVTGQRVVQPDPEDTAEAPDQEIVVTGRYAPPPTQSSVIAVIGVGTPSTERYEDIERAEVMRTVDEPVSTFSVDVDTGSYANVRRFLKDGGFPPADAVRVEEMVNYFAYDYPLPADRQQPFSVNVDAAVTPWNDNSRLVRIGLKGYDVDRSERPPANLVFLIDVSGSMQAPDKLPLVKQAMTQLAREMRPQDRVSIVTYAGNTEKILNPTNDIAAIEEAIGKLGAGGSTAGAAGLTLAYQAARSAFIEDGINRVMLATDGDFNVGISDQDQLVEMIEREADTGVQLTTLGFGTGNYNEAMMEQIADHGNGNYAYIDDLLEARKVLGEELGSTLFTIAKDVKVQVEWNPAVVAEYRLIGYENRALSEEDFDNDQVDAGEIGAGHDVTALYEIALYGSGGERMPERRYEANRSARGAADPAQRLDELGELRLRYKLPDEEDSRLIKEILPTRLATAAGPARGDMALAAAVAAFGQKLSGGKYIGDLSYAEIADMAPSGGYYPGEFKRLVEMAGSNAPGGAGGE